MLLALFASVGAIAEDGDLRIIDTVGETHKEYVCRLIEREAERAGLPKAFFARLIWRESRFDPNAVSPNGGQGIAQFTPEIARLRKLDDPFDIEKALTASASYLAEMTRDYGNIGLATIGYDAGEERLRQFIATGKLLPLETLQFVYDILGEAAPEFIDRAEPMKVEPLHKRRSFQQACIRLPTREFPPRTVSNGSIMPWGAQVAGHFNAATAQQLWRRYKSSFGNALGDTKPTIIAVRSNSGPKPIYAVRISASTRKEAEKICEHLRAAGGPCLVVKNRTGHGN